MSICRNTLPMLATMFGLVATTGSLARADVIFVDVDAAGADNGTTWDDAFNDLQDGLAAAAAGDEIWVAKGTYAPSGPGGDRKATFQLISGVGLYGGFVGDETNRDQRDWETNETILTGDLNGDDGSNFTQNQENSYHVVTGSGTDETAVFDGFTITAGNANIFGDTAGGGMLNSNAFLKVANCTFHANSSTKQGGGMSNTDSDLVIVNCVFSGNLSDSSGRPIGGGLANEGSNPFIVNCIFAGNVAHTNQYVDANGGGVGNIDGSSPVLLGCVFSGNAAANYGKGGGLYAESGSLPILINCTFHGNYAGFSGDAVAGPAILTNCIAWSDVFGGGDPLSGDQTVSYSNIRDGYFGEGNIDANPLFIDPFGPDGEAGTADDDLRLSPGSPCIDAANNAAVPPDSLDLDGDGDTLERTPRDRDGAPRFVDDLATSDTGLGTAPVVDMGAYEFYDCNGNGIPDDIDIAEGTSQDCTGNDIPDQCEADCNSNGQADSCDTIDGTSKDCNENEIPDECIELEADCNVNAVPDACDIADGTSQDINGNGVPDECEDDCNANGIPDDLDIASGTSLDCNANAIPDDCEPDCNEDGILDQCDLVVIERVITTEADGAGSVFAADLDGDGDLDVLSASQYDNTIAWYENPDGLGNFGPPQIITTAADSARSVFAADLDGDGDTDVLSASFDDDKIAWYENTDGLGSFGPQRIITTGASGARSVFAADLDGDGDIDVLSASDVSGGGKIEWYENTDGLGSFGPQQIITTAASWARAVFAADLDGDGDIDALSASFNDDKIAWYENIDGLGSFGPQKIITTDANGARSVFAADLDGDGDLDVLSASEYDDEIAWYENTDALGSFGLQRIISTAPNGPVSVFAADLDGDGDYDVLSASNNFSDDTIAWYENADGLGNFGPQRVITDTAVFAMAVFAADVDGDGDIDVLSASRDDDTIAWYSTPSESDCNGNAIPDVCDIDAETSQDCNGNGTPDDCEPDCNGNDIADECDISSGTSQDCTGNEIPDECEEDCNGNGLADICDIAGGTSKDCNANGIPDECIELDFDCNANAVPDSCDIAEGTSEDCNENEIPDECDFAGGTSEDCNQNEIPDDCEPDCNGNEIADECDITAGTSQDCNANGTPDECDALFVEQVITTEADGPLSVFAVDLDGDGDNDVISALWFDDEIAWYENTDELGSFGPKQVITIEAESASSVFAADLDGDGDTDVLSASFADDKIAWYENTDGLGSFGPQEIISTAPNGPYSVFAADLDGDGDIDVLSASRIDDKIAWYENTDGLGSFGPQQVISTEADGAMSVFATDLDGDGDSDVLSASSFDDEIAWYENTDGLGHFGPQQIITTEANRAVAVFAADMDGDGDTDVLSASRDDDTIAWYENTDGLGSFGPLQVITSEADGAQAVFAVDLDGDGDADVLSASQYDNTIAWYENTDGLGSFGPRQLIDTEAEATYSVFAADVNGDGRPDALSASYNSDKIAWYANPEFISDCNGNGVSDSCDIAAGTSQDTDENGIPDECETLTVHNLTQGTDHPTIQQAINSASTGDVIEVDPRTYVENVDFLEKDVTLRSTDPLDLAVVESTIIDGGGHDTVVTLSAGTVSGFTITGGVNTGLGAGGVQATGTAVVSYNVITGNVADEDGGGVAATDSAVVSNNRITFNEAGDVGGGVNAKGDSVVIDNYIAFNEATSGGGGLSVRFNSMSRNNTIVFNSSAGAGGGIAAGLSAIVLNNIVAFSTDGTGIHITSPNVTADYNCVFGNFDGEYSGDAVAGSNDLNVDPLLDADQLHLTDESPCVDAGDPGLVPLADETDIDNEERIQNARVDIGADETPLTACEGDANGDGTVDPLDSGFVLARFGCPVGTGDPSCDAADQNGDGSVDPLDSGFVLARFGECP